MKHSVKIMLFFIAFQSYALFSGPSVKVMQYNILAAYLGQNYMPWFLFDQHINTPNSLQHREHQQKTLLDMMAATKNGKPANPQFATWFKNCVITESTTYVKSEPEECRAYEGIFSALELLRLKNYNDQYFDWSERRNKIYLEIEKSRPDIISLVELDDVAFFAEKLGQLGYDHVFLKRPRASSIDGCGIFYLRNRFELKEKIPLVYSDNDRISLLAHFFDRLARKELIFGSTHLMREPDSQAQELVRKNEVKELVTKINMIEKNLSAPVIIAGDFNAEPGSPSINDMIQGGFRPAIIDKQFLKDFKAPCTSKTLARSVWIDYIFYRGFLSDKSTPKAIKDCSNPYMVWPDQNEGSDHVPVIAELAYE